MAELERLEHKIHRIWDLTPQLKNIIKYLKVRYLELKSILRLNLKLKMKKIKLIHKFQTRMDKM